MVKYHKADGIETLKTAYTYDVNDQVTLMEDYDKKNGSWELYRSTKYTYDALKRMSSYTEWDGEGAAPAEPTVSYTYDIEGLSLIHILASLLQNKKIPGERLLSNGITNEKSDGKALVKKFLNLFLVVAVLGCITGCGRNDQKDKLYYAIDNNNLQGLTEVLADDPDFDFDKLDQHDFTTFRKNDYRALAFAFDGVADDTMIMKLIDSGRVDVNNDDDKITYLSNAVCYRSMDIVKALIEHGADVNAGEDTALGSLLRNRTDSIDRQERIELLVSRGAAVDAELFKSALKNEDKYIGMSYVCLLYTSRCV